MTNELEDWTVFIEELGTANGSTKQVLKSPAKMGLQQSKPTRNRILCNSNLN